MMFLTRGEIHQEPLWELWFKHLAGLVPVSALRVSLPRSWSNDLLRLQLQKSRLRSLYCIAPHLIRERCQQYLP